MTYILKAINRLALLLAFSLCWSHILLANDLNFQLQESEPHHAGHHTTSYLPDGNGMIPVGSIFDYPRISALDVDNADAFWYTWRPNLFNRDVEEKWDFYNLINTDRPDFTDATFTVGKGVTIIETGYTYRKQVDYAAQSDITKRSLPEVLLRKGITDEFELRLKWNGYVLSDVTDKSTALSTQVFGSDDLLASFKYEIWQQHEWMPMFTVLSGTTIPSGTNGVSSNQLQPFVNGVIGWGIRRWLYLKMSAGVDWQKTSVSTLVGGGSEPAGPALVLLRDNIDLYHNSASLLFQATQRVGGFIEYFGFTQSGGGDNRALAYGDTGLYYYATNNLQFDIRIGQRFSDRVNEVFTGAGISVRY